MNTWRLIAHHEEVERAIDRYLNKSRIAIGWGFVGDLRLSQPNNASEITELIKRARLDNKNAHIGARLNVENSHLGGPSLWRFFHEMDKGDFVILSDGHKRRAVLHVIGDYEWTEKSPLLISETYCHQRLAEKTNFNPDDLWERCHHQADGENIRWPLVRCKDLPKFK
jgi:predicted Mrr-cat superfamily restriction endonuclease